MYYVYILQSLKDNSYYIGSTSNLGERIKRHNRGGSKYTKYKKPWKLVYKESYLTKSEAVKREKYIKKQKDRSFIYRLIMGP